MLLIRVDRTHQKRKGTITTSLPHSPLLHKVHCHCIHSKIHPRIHINSLSPSEMPRPACGECSRVFPMYRSLAQHQDALDHEGYECVCGRSFATIESLNQHRHASSVHTGRICMDCDEDFFEDGSLEKHYQARSGIITSRDCYCGRSFGSISAALQHVRTSSNHPHFCNACDKSFRNEEDKTCHTIIYHGSSSESESSDEHHSEQSSSDERFPVYTSGYARFSPSPEIRAPLAAVHHSNPAPPAQHAPTCNICLEHPQDKVVTHCGHLYCRSCIVPALNED
ncbi:hypothetical protein FRC03_002185, partial [Tulasnella sp. 419]